MARHQSEPDAGASAAYFITSSPRGLEGIDQFRALHDFFCAGWCLAQGDMACASRWHDLGAIFVRRGDLDAALSAYGKLPAPVARWRFRPQRAAATTPSVGDLSPPRRAAVLLDYLKPR